MPDSDDNLEPIDLTLNAQSVPPAAPGTSGQHEARGYAAGSLSSSAMPRRRSHIAAAIGGVVVLMLIAGFIGYATTSQDHATSAKAATSPTRPGPSTTPSTPADPIAAALGHVVLQPNDVPPSQSVKLIPNGNQLNQPTLDLCNGTFASETLRNARLQVAAVDAQGRVTVSTEAVLYRNADATVQAFAEIRKIAAQCPSTPVPSRVGEPTVTTKFNAAPDTTWPQRANVDRLAYDVVSSAPQTGPVHSTVVYLRRGRILLGIYFTLPAGTRTPIAHNTTIPGVVASFESRVGHLPSSLVAG